MARWLLWGEFSQMDGEAVNGAEESRWDREAEAEVRREG